MGIFDNVNMQQMMPWMMAGLSAGAAYADPRSGPMLAESGWNAVRTYMAQQKMQQDQEQFQERMKAVQQELSMRQQREDREEKAFGIAQEERLAADFMLSNMDVLNNISDSAGVSEYYNRFNARAREKGMKPIPYNVFAKVQSNFEFMPTPTGEVGFGIGPDGNLAAVEKIKTAKGMVWKPVTSNMKVSPDMLRQAREAPELAIGWAKSLRNSGNDAMASMLEDQANRILGEKQRSEFEKSYAESINEIKAEQKMMEDTFKLKFSEDNRPADPAKAEEWETRRDDALKAMQSHVNDRFDRLNRMRGEVDPEFKKQYAKERKRGAEEFETSLDDDEKQLYAWMITDLKSSGVSKDRAGQTARTVIELRRKKGLNVPTPQGIPGDITKAGYKSPIPVSVKPTSASAVGPTAGNEAGFIKQLSIWAGQGNHIVWDAAKRTWRALDAIGLEMIRAAKQVDIDLGQLVREGQVRR